MKTRIAYVVAILAMLLIVWLKWPKMPYEIIIVGRNVFYVPHISNNMVITNCIFTNNIRGSGDVYFIGNGFKP